MALLLHSLAKPVGILALSRLALACAVELSRRFLIIPSHQTAQAGCSLGLCEASGWIPIALATTATAGAVSCLWLWVEREDGEQTAASAVLLFVASPLSLVLALDAVAAVVTALGLFALLQAPRRALVAGVSLAAATLLIPTAALLAPAALVACGEAFHTARIRLVAQVALPPAVIWVAGVIARASPWSPLVTAPAWSNVAGLTGGSPSTAHLAVLFVVCAGCGLAFAMRRLVAGLASAPWLLLGLGLAVPAAAHLGACAVSIWGPTAKAARHLEIEAPLVGALFVLQGLWLFHLVHAYALL